MNKTLWQIRDSILEAIHSYEITDDSVLEPELIEDKIVDLRSTLILEESKAGMVDQGYYQALENLEVVYEDLQYTVSPNVVVAQKRTLGTVIVPGLNTRIGRKAILYVGLSDFSYAFDHKTLQGLLAHEGAMYTHARYAFAVSGARIYVKNYGREGKRLVSALVILEDPRKVPGFDYRTSDFPVSDPQKLELLVIKHILSTLGFPADKVSDANVNVETPKPTR